MEELEPTNISTYWPNNTAFDPKRVLFRRLFFINADRTKYVSLVSTMLTNIYHWESLELSGGALDPKH